MAGGVSVLDFDGTYRLQLRLQRAGYEWIHLLDLEGVRGYCTVQSLARIKERLKRRRAREVTLLGSGQYHYVSLLLLGEIRQPFTLILFDRHSDMMQAPAHNLISCGSWARAAVKRIPHLRRVVLLGVSDEGARLVPSILQHKVASFTYRRLASTPARDIIRREIPTEAVYISIDKDVLSPRDALTDWGQGQLALQELIAFIDEVAHRRRIIGVDICGEYSCSPADRFRPECVRAARLNETANLLLIEAVASRLPQGPWRHAAG